MEVKIFKHGHTVIAEIIPEYLQIGDLDEFVDLLGNANYLGAEMILMSRHNLPDEFFDLKTGLAGEILQKFSNYRQRLTILGDFSKIKSKSLKDFIYESNIGGKVMFMENRNQLG